jgi:hypothetical protein
VDLHFFFFFLFFFLEVCSLKGSRTNGVTGGLVDERRGVCASQVRSAV